MCQFVVHVFKFAGLYLFCGEIKNVRVLEKKHARSTVCCIGLCLSVFYFSNNSLEGCGVVQSQVGKHLAVDFDA